MNALEFESRVQLARVAVENCLTPIRRETVDGFNAATYSRVCRALLTAERAVCEALDEAQTATGRTSRGLVHSLIGTDAFPPPYGTRAD